MSVSAIGAAPPPPASPPPPAAPPPLAGPAPPPPVAAYRDWPCSEPFFTRRRPPPCEQVLVSSVPAGGSCHIHNVCGAGAACVLGEPSTCRVRSSLGGPCGEGFICDAETYCDWNGFAGSNTCLATVPDGSSCSGTGEMCASRSCDAALEQCAPAQVCN